MTYSELTKTALESARLGVYLYVGRWQLSPNETKVLNEQFLSWAKGQYETILQDARKLAPTDIEEAWYTFHAKLMSAGAKAAVDAGIPRA